MKPKELKIGNFIVTDIGGGDKIMRIFEITDDSINGFKKYLRYGMGIPVTEEWLKFSKLMKTNSTKFHNGYITRNKKYLVQLIESEFVIFVDVENKQLYQLLTGGHYIHELQNILYFLTHEEVFEEKNINFVD